MAALSLMTPLYYLSHKSVYKDRYCRSQFARSPILRPSGSASLDINVANRLLLPSLLQPYLPFQPIVFFLSLSLLHIFSRSLLQNSQLTRAIAAQSSTRDCTQSAANWEMIGGASADSIAPLTTPAAPLYNRQPI